MVQCLAVESLVLILCCTYTMLCCGIAAVATAIQDKKQQLCLVGVTPHIVSKQIMTCFMTLDNISDILCIVNKTV